MAGSIGAGDFLRRGSGWLHHCENGNRGSAIHWGTSLTVTYIAYSATAASALQCANSSWRTTNELINPQLRLGILTQIKDQVGATLAIGSSTFFGNINHIIIALYEELSEYDL